jgi:hypothetical protein
MGSREIDAFATVSEAALLDAMIAQRLTAEGKTLVDDAQIARLRKAINDLDNALGGLGA